MWLLKQSNRKRLLGILLKCNIEAGEQINTLTSTMTYVLAVITNLS